MIEITDKYRSVKITLNKILNDKNSDVNILLDSVYRTNKIVINAYQFIRLYLLYQYKNNENLLILNKDIIKIVYNTITIDKTKGKDFKGEKLKLFNKFKDFYNNHYKLNNKLDASNLSYILNYTSKDMITNIENNIKLYFLSYIKRFIKSSFKIIHNKLIDDAPKGQKTKLKKELNKELIEVINDIINNTLLSKEKYHSWIIEHKKYIIPINYKKDDHLDDPMMYIKYMIYMCLEIEKTGTKSFQFMPIRTSLIPKYIAFDTSALIDLLLNKNKLNNNKLFDTLTDKYKIKLKEYQERKKQEEENEDNEDDEEDDEEDDKEDDEDDKEEEIKEIIFSNRKTQLNKSEILNNVIMFQEEVWNHYFYINHNVFSQRNYSFDYKLSTDGYSCSIQMIRNNYIEGENKKKKNKKTKRKKMDKFYTKLTLEEKEEYIKNKENKKKKENIEKKKKLKEKYKNLTDKEKEVIKSKMNKEEFIYIDDINKEQFNDLLKKDWVVVDPGKKNLLSMMSNKGVYMKYTNRNHIFNTKRLKYQSYINHFKIKSDIFRMEEVLSKYSSKTCNFEKYKETINIRNQLYDEYIELYKYKIFRQYRWYSHINKKKAENSIIKEIKNKFGKDINIIYGDWSVGKQMKNFISTPNISLKRNIARKFNLYNIDEYRTSKLNYKTEEETDNLYLPDKKGVIRKIHSVLTYKTENGRSGCINRDVNAVNNMVKIVNYFIKHRDRPEKYKRSYKKSIQPTKVC